MSGETKHTPGPWMRVGRQVNAQPHAALRGFTTQVCTFGPGASANWEANARRIVAAVNACEGIPTDALARGAVAELVEAAKGMSAAARHSDPQTWHDAVDALDAAVAKLTYHIHHAGEGDNPDPCALCGRDIRAAIHRDPNAGGPNDR